MDSIDRIRAFNRFYTRQLGLFQKSYLEPGMSLLDARVLFELGQGGPLAARDLMQGLDVDEGQLSRALKGLEGKGWIARAPSETDARRRPIALSEAGQAKLAGLIRRARQAVAGGLDHLSAEDIAGLAQALDTAQAMMADSRPDVALRDLQTGDAGWLIQRHAELYARDEGFDASFEPLVAQILADYLRARDPGCERAWIACRGEERLGSIFCVRGAAPGAAKLRLFLLEPKARGLGLGQRLLSACLAYAREKGYEKLGLWTHESHRAACALYAKNGFTLVDARPVHNFGRDLVEQSWEIEF